MTHTGGRCFMLLDNYVLDFDHTVYFEGDKILKIDGLSELSTTYATTGNASSNGTIIIGRNINSRSVNIVCSVARNKADYLMRYFKPQNEFILYVGDRKINCACEFSKISYDDGYELDPFITLTLLCPDPYFYDVSDFGKNIAGIMPLFGFPWRATKADGIRFGYRIFSDRTIFANAGDAAVGLKVIFVAARGTADNISIENLRTGQFVKVNLHLNKGDKLEISTITGQKYIKKNGEDAFVNIDRLSDFFTLSVGDNLLKYNAEIGKTNLDAYLYYTPIYINGEVVEI